MFKRLTSVIKGRGGADGQRINDTQNENTHDAVTTSGCIQDTGQVDFDGQFWAVQPSSVAPPPAWQHPFTELQVLVQHKDMVRLLVSVDDHRIASAADDGLIVIWNVVFGIRLHVLHNHTLAINTMLCLHPGAATLHPTAASAARVLISTASDRIMAFWDVDNGKLLRTIFLKHGTIKCMLACYFGSFNVLLSGGEALCAWTTKGELIAQCAVPCHVNAIINVGEIYLVAAADGDLDIYAIIFSKDQVQKLKLVQQLTSRKELVRSLAVVSSECFASGYDDGQMSLWSVTKFEHLRQLSCTGIARTPPTSGLSCSVRHLVCVNEQFLVAAAGCDFIIVDVRCTSKDIVYKERGAHQQSIQYMDVISKSSILVTCASDGSIRLWDLARIIVEIDSTTSTLTSRHGNMIGSQQAAVLLGDCSAHSSSVEMVLAFCDGFVSCGTDNLVIAWKDEVKQQLRRTAFFHTLWPA